MYPIQTQFRSGTLLSVEFEHVKGFENEVYWVTRGGRKIYGRGTSDDGQAVFLSLLLLRNIRGKNLKYNLGLAFVADGEVGSKYGIQYLLEKDIFRKTGRKISVSGTTRLWI